MPVADKLNALRIKANLIADERVGLMEIEPEVDEGVAVLRGEVETEEQRRIAEELAYEVEGVDEVINEIKVVASHKGELSDAHLGYGALEGDAGDTAFAIGGESAGASSGLASSEQFLGEFTDEEIEREVREKLDSQDEIDVSDIRFKSVNQIVHLQGSVKTGEDLYKLHDKVLNVRGVMGVSSEVSIKEGEIGSPS